MEQHKTPEIDDPQIKALKELLQQRVAQADDQPKKSNGGGLKLYGAMFVIAILVSVALITYMGQATTTALNDMKGSIASVQADVKQAKDAVSNAINNLPATVTSQVSSSVASVMSRLSSVENSINNANNQISANTKALGDVNTAVTKNGTDLKTLNDAVTALSAKLTADEATLTAQETRLKTLETAGATSTTTSSNSGTSSVTSTLNGVTASVTSMSGIVGPWWQNMNGSSAPAAMSLVTSNNNTLSIGSTSFQLIINNTTKAQINNLQLAMAFTFMSADGVTPATVPPNLAMTTMGGYPIWVAQSSTTSNTCMFYAGGYSIWNFSQTPGQASYYTTLTVSGGPKNTTYTVYPMIKVISFTNP